MAKKIPSWFYVQICGSPSLPMETPAPGSVRGPLRTSTWSRHSIKWEASLAQPSTVHEWVEVRRPLYVCGCLTVLKNRCQDEDVSLGHTLGITVATFCIITRIWDTKQVSRISDKNTESRSSAQRSIQPSNKTLLLVVMTTPSFFPCEVCFFLLDGSVYSVSIGRL